MAVLWQKALADGGVPPGQVIAVTNHYPEVAEKFRREHQLEFPIYQDVAQTFRGEFDVSRFPLEIVVGAPGMIESTSYDSTSPIDFDSVADQLER